MPPSTPTFAKADCDTLARYGSARVRWSRVDSAGKRALTGLRARLKALVDESVSRFEGSPVSLKTFVSPTHAHERVLVDSLGCIYPAAVPSKSFGLQYAFILSANGAELCFCMGTERRNAGRVESAATNRRMLEEAQQQLAHLPPDVLEAVEHRLRSGDTFGGQTYGGWRLRKASRRGSRTNDFDSFAEWAQYAASPLGEGASVSCNIAPKALEKIGDGIVDRFVEMLTLFAPVFEYVYAPDPVSDEAIGDQPSPVFPPTGFAPQIDTGVSIVAEHPIMPYNVRVQEPNPASAASTSRTPSVRPTAPPFTVDEAVTDLFIPRTEFEHAVSLLSHKQNLILEGAPGVGKTFVARRLAYALLGVRDASRVEMVQFHQSYSYEDFVQGWRPAAGGGFVLRNGVFYDFARSAAADPTRSYVFLIDEINRGNVSRIFGELLMLLERDKRGDAFAVPLTYALSRTDRFFVPPNLYFIGTMNTADRSLAMVDYALRRRFAFVRLQPAFGEKSFLKLLAKRGVPRDLARQIAQRMQALNDDIVEDRKRLGPGFEIGHSFFVPAEPARTPTSSVSYDDAWYRGIVMSEIEPLLREYWFDDPDRVADAVAKLLA